MPLQTAGRFIALRLDEGDHTIVLETHLSPLRLGLMALTAVIFMAASILWILQRRRSTQ